MKTTSTIVIILGLTLIFACKKEKKEMPTWPLGNYWKGPQTFGKVQALRNGELWEASGIAFLSDQNPICSISFGTFDSIDTVEMEHIAFSSVPYLAGLYKVSHGDWVNLNGVLTWINVSNQYALVDHDLVGLVFYPDTTKNNWIQIESIDTIQKIIKGKFDVTYRISPEGEASTNYPREVHFSGGVFEVKVHQ